MYCPKCGLSNTDISTFCKRCGTRLASSATVPRTASRPPAAAQAPYMPPPPTTGTTVRVRGPRRRGVTLVVIIAMSVLVIAAAVLIVIGFGFPKDKNDPRPVETDRSTVDPYSLVTISYDETEATKDGEQTVTARLTVPDFVQLYQEASSMDDPEKYFNDQLNNGDYETTTIEQEVRVNRSGETVSLVDEQEEKEKALDQALIEAVNAMDDGDLQ